MYIERDLHVLGVIIARNHLNEELLIGLLVLPHRVGPGHAELEVLDDHLLVAEEAAFGVLLFLELQVEVSEFILGALVGLYFLVFDDLAEA